MMVGRGRRVRREIDVGMKGTSYGIIGGTWVMVLWVGLTVEPAAADEEFLYKLGGGEPIGIGAADRSRTRTFGLGVSWDNELMCGRFDVGHSIGNQLNGVTGAFQTVMSDVVSSAQGVVASLPMLAIQRLNPGLYDLLQNGVLEASQEFRMARMRCQEVTAAMGETLADGGWSGVARREFWRRQAGLGGDILDVVEEAEESGGDEGVPWIGGTAKGGDGQDPIRPGPDAARAGMNSLLGRRVGDESEVSAGACAGGAICRVWSSPADLDAWIVKVFGETEIRTCEGCQKVRTSAGEGLASVYRDYLLVYETVLVEEASVKTVPSAESLAVLSAGGGFKVSRRVLEALREEDDGEGVARRLAGEMAIARTVDEALLVRRALWAGVKEPNVANNEVGRLAVLAMIDELDGDLEGMEREMRMRAALASSTTVAVLERQHARRIMAEVPASQYEVGGVAEGAVIE